MASYRALPEFLSNVSRRFATPVAASILVGVLLIALTWVYLLATSVQNAFNDVIAVTGELFAIFYIMTALAMMVYYRRRVFGSARDALILGLLPLGAAGFLGWMLVRTLQNSASTQRWSLIGDRCPRPGHAAGRPVRPAVAVLQHPAGKRQPGQLTGHGGRGPCDRSCQRMARAGLASQVSQSGR